MIFKIYCFILLVTLVNSNVSKCIWSVMTMATLTQDFYGKIFTVF